MDSHTSEHLLYEMAMSIGNSDYLDEMLTEALASIKEQLNLSSVLVLKKLDDEIVLEQSIPENFTDLHNSQSILSELQKRLSTDQEKTIQWQIEDTFVYAFELKDFGFLVLLKPEIAILSALLKPFERLVQKLGHEIQSCLNQKALNVAKNRLLESQSMAKIGSWELDLIHNKLWWSEEVFKIFEIDSTRFGASYETFLGLIHPDDRVSVQQAYERSLLDKQPYQIEHRLLFPDGRIKYVYEHANSYFDADGNPVRSIGSVQDITDTKLAKISSQQREKELNTIIESLPLTLFVKEAKELRFVRFNAAGEKLMGFKREELLGKNDYDFFPKEQADFFTGMDRETLTSGMQKTVKREEIDTPNGKRLLHTIKAPILDANGNPEYLLGISEDITEQVEAEKLLIESESRLKEAQAVAKLGHYVLDVVKGIWTCSEVLDSLFEIDASYTHDVAGWLDLIHPLDRVELADYLQNEVLLKKQTFDKEYRILTANNQIEKWVHGLGNLKLDDKGDVIEMFGTIQDITERKQTELALEDSEQKFADLYNAIDDAIFLLDMTESGPASFVEVNEVACKRLGYSREEFLQMSPLDIDAEGSKNPEKILHNLKYIVENNGRDFETTHITKEGVLIPVEMRVRVIDYQGRKVLMAVARDISERKQQETSLQLSATVIENLVEGIMICDPDINIVAINPAFTSITGYTLDEIKGKNPGVLKSGRHDNQFYQDLWHSLDTVGSWQGEIWNRRFNGEIYPEWLSVSSIRDESGQVINYIGVFSDITTIKENEAELRFLAHHDPLTKLPNRILLNDRIAHALDQVKRNNTQVALLYLDLDRFKAINHSFGHPHGDLLLQTVALRLQDVLREEDTVSRVSGDEFVILLEGLHTADEAGVIAQKILTVLSEAIQLEEHEVRITASIGIAMGPVDGNEAVQLLKNADIALYRAKDTGRNNFEYFSSDMSSASFEALFMINGLHKGIDNNEFVVYYQPQLNMKSNQLIGAEALIRWQHPDIGLVPPGKFIPLAEDAGVIVKLGEWVLRQSCAQMKKWLSEGVPVNYIAVNVSGRQLLDKNIVNTVKRALEDTGLDGHYIELEVTETVVMKEQSFSEVLCELKKLGVRISIDDFGTGYSSLVRLKHLPIDKLKIDMSFIKGIPADEEDCNITQTIISLAHSMNLDVLAEGVETLEQAEFLLNRDCVYAQGYLYNRPIPADEFEAWTRQKNQ